MNFIGMHNGCTLLLIEDEENLRSLMARVIALEGYKDVQAKDAKRGLKSLENVHIQVVITDVRLPAANGVQLTRILKEKFPTVEVIVLTAFDTLEDGV